MEGSGEGEQSRQRERERGKVMGGAPVILKGDRGKERLVVKAGDEGRSGVRRDCCCCLEMERRRLRESVFHRETNNKRKISK